MSTPTHTPPRWRHRMLALLTVGVAAVPALSPDGSADAAVPSNNVFPIASPGARCNDDFGVPRPGTIGDTGNACGRRHLHFQMKLSSSSRPIDPHPYVSTWPIVSPGGGGGGTGDSYQPTGRLDSANARGAGTIGLYGWSFDPDTRTQSIPVDVLIVKSNGTRQTIRLTANKLRTDIGAAYPGAGNYHGFELVLSGLPRGSTMRRDDQSTSAW